MMILAEYPYKSIRTDEHINYMKLRNYCEHIEKLDNIKNISKTYDWAENKDPGECKCIHAMLL